MGGASGDLAPDILADGGAVELPVMVPVVRDVIPEGTPGTCPTPVSDNSPKAGTVVA